MGAGASAHAGTGKQLSHQLSFQSWLALLIDSAALGSEPCCLVTCSGKSARRERVAWANTLWYKLLEYSEQAVVNRAFSQIRGFQGPLTSEWSKLQLATLLVTKESRMETSVINYTGVSRRPLKLGLSVQVFRWEQQNSAFLCTVKSWEEAAPQAVLSTPRAPPEAAWEAWLAAARAHVAARAQPCLLVLTRGQGAARREFIDCGNRVWLDLCEFQEADIARKAFSELPGFQGELTSEASKLQLASLLITKEATADVKVVNYSHLSRRAMEMQVHITIFKMDDRNVAFLESVERVLDAGSTPSCEPEPEDQAVFPALSAEEARQLQILEEQCRRLIQN